MNVAVKTDARHHPFLTGTPKRLFIDGSYFRHSIHLYRRSDSTRQQDRLRSVGRAHKLARSIRAGSVWINCYQAMDPAVPFGGYKMSGYGRESGKQHVEEYLNVKAVWIKTA